MDAESRRRLGRLLEQFLTGLACLEPMAMAGYAAGAEAEALDRDRSQRSAGNQSGSDPMSLRRPLTERPRVLGHLA